VKPGLKVKPARLGQLAPRVIKATPELPAQLALAGLLVKPARQDQEATLGLKATLETLGLKETLAQEG
jgi:hypothetical protein